MYIISEVCTLESLTVKLAPTKCGTKEVSKKIIVFVNQLCSECTRIDLRRCKNPNFPGGACPQIPLDYGGHSPPQLLNNQMKSQPPYSKTSSYATAILGKEGYTALLYSPVYMSFPEQLPRTYHVIFSISLSHPVFIKV
jgi:hypothetical protein